MKRCPAGATTLKLQADDADNRYVANEVRNANLKVWPVSGTIGQTLGQYRLEAMVGHGSMADVYRATHLTSGKPAAIKVVHAHLLDQPGFLERFKREAESLAALQHPHIVHLVEFVCQPGEAYLVMEYVGGGMMETRLDQQRLSQEELPLEQVLDWMESIASAVDFAHTRGLIHRDLKPANILFRETGEPVLTDFGLAHLLGHTRLSGSNAITGTPAYLSPEQARGLSGDVRSDIYSLGVILYEILTGQTPFQGSSVSIVFKHISEPPPSPRLLGRYLPPGVEAVVMRCLAKNPTERYQSAQAMVRALRAAINRARPAATDEQPRTPSNAASAVREKTVVEHRGRAALANAPLPPRRVAPPSTPSRFLLPAIILLLAAAALAALGWWGVARASRAVATPASYPHFSVGSEVRIAVSSQAGVSVLRGCPSQFWLGVVGIAVHGDVGQVVARQVCGGEWWYQISVPARATDVWDGIGWLEGRYLQPK